MFTAFEWRGLRILELDADSARLKTQDEERQPKANTYAGRGVK